VVFTFVLFLVAELVLWRYGDMKGRWTRNTLMSVAVVVVGWMGLFLISAVLTVYDDHQNLTGAASRIKTEAEAKRLKLTEQMRSTEKALNHQVVELQTSYAVKEGINQTLQKQNRDQQNTINGCLSQAMKFLSPEPQKIAAIVFDHDESNEVKKIRWLVVSNKTITPVLMNVVCDRVLEDGVARIVGNSGMLGRGTGKVAPEILGIDISAPSWSPTSPLLVAMSYRGDANISCSFNLR
jgi:hypothetical protein